MENSDNGYQAHQPVQQTVIVQQEQKNQMASGQPGSSSH